MNIRTKSRHLTSTPQERHHWNRNVQRRATKLIPGLKNMSYEERLKHLKLPTLAYRRTREDMIEMFKILTGKYDSHVTNFIQLNTNNTRGHQYKLNKINARLDVRKFSFVHRSADTWNRLPNLVMTAPSVKSFERQDYSRQDLVIPTLQI